jgi:excisionase family DNA binding protein|tara:strand:+ start:42 stop:212 length:171 start_codon:yes stop_codon:yes gene_type:complete
MTPQGVLSCTEIARRIGKDKETIRKWCREGKFPSAFKIGTEWLVDEKDILERAGGK